MAFVCCSLLVCGVYVFHLKGVGAVSIGIDVKEEEMENLSDLANKLHQVTMEDAYSRVNIRKYVIRDIGETLEFKELLLKERMNEHIKRADKFYDSKKYRIKQLEFYDMSEFATEVILAIVTSSINSDKPVPIQSVIGSLMYLDIFTLAYSNPFDAVKTIGEFLSFASDIDLCDIQLPSISETGSITISSNYKLSYDAMRYIERTSYMPPLVYKPKYLKNNFSSPYLSPRIKQSVFVGKCAHREKVSLDVLNILNRTALCLDEEVLTGLIREEDLGTEEDLNYSNMVRESREVYKELFDAGNKFYFSHAFDSRGRTYCRGYHVNYQGSPFKRASISLVNKEVISC